MLEFICHKKFEKETVALQRRFSGLNDGIKSFKMIAELHFHPISPKCVFAPSKLHRIKAFENSTIYKIELAVRGLRANQSPRLWFMVQGASVVLLAIESHCDNYDDNEQNRIAEERMMDLL